MQTLNRKNQPSRWSQFGTSIFSVMSQAANQHAAVNLAQGFPDFDGPDCIKEAAMAAIKEHKNQYAPAIGIPELRAQLVKRQARKSAVNFCVDREVTVFSGATEAIFSTIVALLGPGDEIITFAPYYDSYPAAALAAGATFRSLPLAAPNWEIDFAKLESLINAKTRMLLINSPHNPAGKVFNIGEMTKLAALAKKHDLIVVTDEVYEEIIFDDRQHIYFSALPEMRERTVTISSTSKTFSMTGWKIGYAFAPEPLMREIRSVHQFTVFCSATPLQWGMVAALDLQEDYFVSFRAEYLARRNFMVDALRACGFAIQPPQGSYFAIADYSTFSNKPDVEFAMWLSEHVKVATIPISPFYDDKQTAANLHCLRFAFCKGLPTLEQAAKNLGKLRGKLR